MENTNTGASIDEASLTTAGNIVAEGANTGLSIGNKLLTPPEATATQATETAAEPIMQLSTYEVNHMTAGSIVDKERLNVTDITSLFSVSPISEDILGRINGISYKENNQIKPAQLRHLRILHKGFDGESHVGELIVNEALADTVCGILKELYENNYPIEKMHLVDEYGGDDDRSMADNNSSAFNYRVVAGTTHLSKHSLGLAIDINPRYNPYIRTGKNGETIIDPSNGSAYADRNNSFAYKIDKNDLAYKLFTSHGFTWGGSWNTVKDYQHFEFTR
ncbi:hypothetical protein FACS1894111_00790 [Clostridia bacterium]|nr:hypothetical protein FACS1894111_00790 [Clostridia bacterium]